MKDIELKKIYTLNPYYTLRNDRKRIILCKSPSFKVPLDIAEDDIFVFIHPAFAVMLSLFNGIDTLNTVITKMTTIFSTSFQECYEFISPFLENKKRIGIEYDSISFEFPKMILLENINNKYVSRE